MDPTSHARPDESDVQAEIDLLEARYAETARPNPADPANGPRRRPTWRRVLLAFVLVMVVGNVGIAVVSQLARSRSDLHPLHLAGVPNGWVVDEHLWRGAAPTDEGYVSLAAAGVTTIVDLRAEADLAVPDALLADLGVERIAIPVRDGQTPSDAQVQRFVAVMDGAGGDGDLVFVHCGAGVGRTGSMVGAYRALRGDSSGLALLADTLVAGPPSVEQLAYVFGASVDGLADPGPLVTGVSRVLDAPRRIWHNLT